jgi:peptide/nickel transport system substrate-binding protein
MPDTGLSRRQMLGIGAVAVASSLTTSARGAAAESQSPKRGGVLTLRAWDPPNFDLQMFDSYKTHILYSFTHSRLLRHRSEPGLPPGTFPIEGDLAESWSQPSETVYQFRLRRGVRWHNRPPVHGRELTAEDIAYSVRRGLGESGRAALPLRASLDRVEVVDRYTVKLVLRTPLTWLPDIIASPMMLPIVAKECVETFGDLQKAEAMVGTGPWQLDSYRRNVGITLTRHPDYFRPGLPLIDRIELVLDDDSTRVATAFLTGKYDLGWDPPGAIPRPDWVQLRDRLRAQRPGIHTAEILDSSVFVVYMRTDRPPFNDLRVRQAISMAINRREIIESVLEGAGAVNPPVQAALKEWSLPVDQLGAGASCYRFDPLEAKRLLTQAGHGGGFQTVMSFTSYGRIYTDMLQLVARDLQAIGIDTKLTFKEYGAFVATVPYGNFEGMALAGFPIVTQPYTSLFSRYYPKQPPNSAHVDDPTLTGLLDQLAGAQDTSKRRELVHAIQRHAAVQQYYVHLPSGIHVAAWDAALKNYAPNMSTDYGGRLAAAWLDR